MEDPVEKSDPDVSFLEQQLQERDRKISTLRNRVQDLSDKLDIAKQQCNQDQNIVEEVCDEVKHLLRSEKPSKHDLQRLKGAVQRIQARRSAG